jgi:ABC-type multidrug transport system ATPase subunit
MGFNVNKEYQEARHSVGIVPQELVFDPFFNVRNAKRNNQIVNGLTLHPKNLLKARKTLWGRRFNLKIINLFYLS